MAAAGGITWYDILGVSPGADATTIRDAYARRLWQLRAELLAGAPSPVVSAAGRARDAVGAAWLVLGDPGRRLRYDRESGVQGAGGMRGSAAFGGQAGAVRSAPVPDYEPREAGAVLEALAVWAAPAPARPRRQVSVPDVRGLFFRPCRDLVTMAGLRLEVVRLTPDPMAVEGLVTGQSPGPGARARRGSTLTVEVWHPARHK